MKRFLLAGLVCITIAALPACNVRYFEGAEFGDITWDPSFAVPVGEISYTIEELFEELNDAGANVGSNSEDVVTLSYLDTLQSQSASQFLAILDQSFGGAVTSGVNLSNPPATVTVSSSEIFEFDLTQRTDEVYDSIGFKSGTFNFSAESDFDAQVNFTATFISLENNDAPLVISGSLNPASNTFSQSEDITGYQGLFHEDDQGNPSSNKFLLRLDYDAIVTPTSTINDSDRINFTLNISNTTFQNVYGNVGMQSLAVNFDVVDLDFFKDFDAGNITFADPMVSFIFDNSFGFPLGIDFQEIAAIESDGTILPLQGAIVDNLQIIDAPTVEQEGQVIRTEISMSASNSNIDDLISAQPTKVIIEVEAESNPAVLGPRYNFVNDASILDVFVNIEIPLELNINALNAQETVDFNNGGDLEEAKQLLFRIIAENELPLGGLIELQFRDASDNTIFTIDERPAFAAAPVGANGRTTEAAMSTTDILLTDEEIRLIEGATSINVVATLSTTDAQQGDPVKFFSDYELKFRLAVQADIEISSNSN